MPDAKQLETDALAAVNAAKAWYRSTPLWAGVASGFVAHGLVRLALHWAFGWHV